MRFLPTILFISAFSSAFAQFASRDTYNIKPSPKNEFQKRCGELVTRLNTLPPEIQFAATHIGDSIFLVFDEPKYFAQFFQSKKDGFAIDILNQDQFQCDKIQRLAGGYIHKGFLLQPVYRDEMRKRLRISSDGAVYVFGGLVPKNFNKDKIETNLMLIQDQYQCSYTAIVNVSGHAWEMLPMGLYYDTLNRSTIEERYKDLSKTLRFEIPFEKNTSVYRKDDIKPLYDSLKLTDYAITDINIRAYTSVEGSLKRNIELQDARAKSIVDAMQSFQPESIQSRITSNENWVEFLDAITNTPYKYMSSMTKDEIKEALKDQKLADKLEPILAKERKAIIELVLEKRVTYSKATPAELKTYFSQTITKKNIDEAMYLQEIIFHKIERQELPTAFLKELDIPKAIEYGSLLVNEAAFTYEYGNHDAFEALKTFTALNDILGSNPKIDYNICALRLKAWVQSKTLPGDQPLEESIKSLPKKGIPAVLVTRMLINYNIVRSEVFYAEGKYADREKSLKFVTDSYKKVKLNDADRVSLAHFLSWNSRFDNAAQVLEPRIKALDASEDLLFYYTTLTISKPKYLKSTGYRSFLLNVVNSNKDRFCHLFDAVSQGGLSFQLLGDDFLKKTWCENCNLPR